jgi:RNA polymerase sigma-70 factor (ECF subfamily)
MTEENASPPFAPERYRAYLRLLAGLQLPRRLHRLQGASDMAHETILKAHRKRDQFRGQTEGEYRGWLRRILANTIADAAAVKEPDVLQALEQSSAHVANWVVAVGRSPAEEVAHAEQLLRVAEALLQLPADERTALEMRYLQNPPWSLPEIANALDRPTPKAVAGLLARGLEKLRGLLREDT